MLVLFMQITLFGMFIEHSASKEADFNISEPCLAFADCEKQEGACKCDQACQLYDDCCPSAINETAVRTDMTYFPQMGYKSCHKLVREGKLSFWVVDRCPRNECFVPADVTHVSNLLPVTDMNDITYRNHRCAECHGVTEFKYWRASVSRKDSVKCVASLDYIRNFTSTSNASLERNVDNLLRKECSLDLYPPVGISPRSCVPDLMIVDNCSSHYLPVRSPTLFEGNTPIEGLKFRNRDCCTEYFGTCADDEDMCIVANKDSKDLSDPFETMVSRSPLEIASTSILFDFTQGLEHQALATEMQYVNVEFKKTLTLHASGKLNRDLTESLFCLIKTYFENMVDSFSLIFYEEKLLQNEYDPTQHILIIIIKMISRRYFRERDVIDLQAWLDSMDLMYSTYETSEETNKMTQSSLTPLTDAQIIQSSGNTSMIQLYQKKIDKKMQSFHHEMIRRNAVCKAMNEERSSPRSRCDRLEARLAIKQRMHSVQFACPRENLSTEKTTNTAQAFGSNFTVLFTIVAILLKKAFILY